MKLAEIGEEALIDRIISKHLLPESAPGLVIGVGDDAAVLSAPADGEESLTIVSTDMLIEGTHFRLDLTTPYQLGWKSVAVNISDIAAMGGLPTWTFVSFGFKPDTQVEFVDELYRGMRECAARFDSTVAGGDTNAAEGNCVISVCQTGLVEPDRLARRKGARPGDRVLVTGWLGNSRAGLELLFKHGLDEAARMYGWLVSTHLMPVPRVPEARAAVETGAVRAMMDLSDGLAADLPKLCKAGSVGAVVSAEKLPISEDVRSAGRQLGVDATDLAAEGGEDFELLMAVAPEHVERVIAAVQAETETPVTEIGEITEAELQIAYPDGTRRPLKGGYEHFA